MQSYVNKIKNKIILEIKMGYKLELLSPETIKLLVRAKKDVDQDKDGETVPKLESAEVVLIHCTLVNNNYQQASKYYSRFLPDKELGQLINIAPHSLTVLKIINVEFQSTEVWFTDQNNGLLEVEDNVNITLIIE